MHIYTTGDIAIVTQDAPGIDAFIEALSADYQALKSKHLIIDLLGFGDVELSHLKHFLPISSSHRLAAKSFVIVSSGIDLDEIPDELIVAPTLQEANDIIEMESIERDLGL